MSLRPALLRALGVATGLALVAPAAVGGDGPSPVAPASADAADLAGPGVAFVPTGTPFAEVLSTARRDGKLVLLVVTTEGSDACRTLARDVLARASVAAATARFVAVAVDAEAGEGPALVERFRVFAFPTVVVADAEGGEVDRLIGAPPPAELVAELARIVRGDGTLAALRRAVADRPDDLRAAIALAKKEAWSDPEDAAARLEAVRGQVAGTDRALEAAALDAIVLASAVTGPSARTLDALERLLTELGDLPEAQGAFARVGLFAAAEPARALAFVARARPRATTPQARAALDDLEGAVHLRAAQDALRRRAAAAAGDADALRLVVRAALEHRLALDDALGWAQAAVERSGRRADALDALGQVLHALDRTAEAVAVETEAVARATDEGERRAFGRRLAAWRAVVAARDAADGAR